MFAIDESGEVALSVKHGRIHSHNLALREFGKTLLDKLGAPIARSKNSWLS